MKAKPWKITAIVLASIIGFMILLFLGYFLYVVISYERFDDNIVIETVNNQEDKQVNVNIPYSISTFNIGFGAYDHDFHFFMDTGTYQDDFRGGKTITGKYARAISKDNVLKNTEGAIKTIKDTKEYDFMLFQEVDTDSDRSYHVNQYKALVDGFGGDNGIYGNFHCSNYHSPYFAYPIHEFHGKSNSGLVTFSKYNIDNNVRRKYPLSNGFDKYFDLDRCFVISKVPVGNGKFLTIINNHMSAYDKGGTVREQQLAVLKEVLDAEKEAGNYVIVGGDFNHDITNIKAAQTGSLWPTKEKFPEWVFCLTDDDLDEGYKFKVDTTVPTCRTAHIPYEEGVNFLAVLDGFIVSDNIEVVSLKNINANFDYSDHNPATMIFKLKA